MKQEPINSEYKEIDLKQVNEKVKGAISGIGNAIINGILFLKRNIIIITILFIIGAVAGYLIDKKGKVYDHQIIVMPNFGSVDYVYSKVKLLSSKIKENDTVFIKSVGINNPKKLIDIEISPINNVYDFVHQRETNFELLKLMAEDGTISKVVEDNMTSKNYSYHRIMLSTKGKTDSKMLIMPLMSYLNDNTYYDVIQKEQMKNLEIKLRANDSIIKQIDGILNSFAKGRSTGSSGGSLVYNENTELSEIIKRKDELINEKAILNISRINFDEVVKETSVSLNVLNKDGVHGKAKFVLPILLIAVFCGIALFIKYFKKQLSIRNL
jgi:hypothetical protein